MDSEKEKTKLLELQAITAAVESTDQGKAESQAQVERMLIECESEIESAKLKAEAEEIEHMAKLETQGLANLLQGLGIQSVLVTDGTTPINLFETAHGLIGS